MTAVVNLTISAKNYNTEMGGILVRDFLLGLRWVSPLLVQSRPLRRGDIGLRSNLGAGDVPLIGLCLLLESNGDIKEAASASLLLDLAC